jgi:hypothetical protein
MNDMLYRYKSVDFQDTSTAGGSRSDEEAHASVSRNTCILSHLWHAVSEAVDQSFLQLVSHSLTTITISLPSTLRGAHGSQTLLTQRRFCGTGNLLSDCPIMALVSEYKTTDLDLVEHGSGNGDKIGGTPMELQSISDHQSSGLDVSTPLLFLISQRFG